MPTSARPYSPTGPLVGRVRAAQVLAVVGFSETTLYRRVKEGSFPAPMRVSRNVSLYDAAEVNAWLRDPLAWAARNKAAQAAPTISDKAAANDGWGQA